MSTKYYKLFDLLNRKGMKKSDLRDIISPKTVAKLSKGEHISGEAIEKICNYLKCQPGDIMEVIYDEHEATSNIITYKTTSTNALPIALNVEDDVQTTTTEHARAKDTLELIDEKETFE